MKDVQPNNIDPQVIWGIVLIALGVIFLLQKIFDVQILHALWPVALIGVGVFLLINKK